MKNTNKTNDIIIVENEKKHVKKAIFSSLIFSVVETIVILAVLSLMLSYFDKAGYNIQLNTLSQIGGCILVFIIFIILNVSSTLPLCEYWTVNDAVITINKINTLKKQILYIINKLFHKSLKVKGTTLEIKNLNSIKIYAVKNMSRGIIYGSIGYNIMVEFFENDEKELIIKSNIDFKKSRFVEFIEFLKNQDIAIIDKNNLLEVVRTNGDINEYLNFERE